MYMRDLFMWTAQVPVGKTVRQIPSEYLYPATSACARLLSKHKHAGEGFQKKIEAIIPGVPGDTGRKFAAFLPTLFCDVMKLDKFEKGEGSKRLFTVEGLSNLEGALRKGRGVILTVAHFGPFEAATAHITSRGYPQHFIRAVTEKSLKIKSAVLERSVHRYRMRLLRDMKSENILYTREKASSLMGTLTELLAANKVVNMTPDAGRASHFFDAPFFDGRIRISTGFAYLTWKLRVPVLNLLSAREGPRVRIFISEPREVEGEMSAAISGAAINFARELQDHVARYPWQWNFLNHLDLSDGRDSGWLLWHPNDPDERMYDFADFNL